MSTTSGKSTNGSATSSDPSKKLAPASAKSHVLRRTVTEHNLKAIRNADATTGSGTPRYLDGKANASQGPAASGSVVVNVVAPDGTSTGGGSDDEYDIKVVPASPSIAGSDVGE